MNDNLNGKQIKPGTVKLDKLDNTTSGQYTLFDAGIMMGLTDAPVNPTDLVNKQALEDAITTAIGTEFSGNISVVASGTDNYIGVGTPNIVTYDMNTVYIVTFANNNTIPNPTLNIDGAGVVTIIKTDETGSIPLDIDDIVAGTQYFLTYNGVELQIYISNPIANPGTYTNLNPVPATLGGVAAGTTFNNTTISSVFNMLLYPYQVANFSSFSISGISTLLEVGSTITAGSKTFLWSTVNPSYITSNTIEISKLTGGTVILGTGFANTGSHVISLPSAITLVTPGTYTWQIKAKRTNNTFFYRTFIVTWAYKMFTGTSANTSLTQSDALAMSGAVKTSPLGTYAFAAGNYKYFVIPNNFVNPTSFKDGATNLTVGMADATDGYTDVNAGPYSFKFLSITNGFGVTQTYRVYRTKYTLGGSINIILS